MINKQKKQAEKVEKKERERVNKVKSYAKEYKRNYICKPIFKDRIRLITKLINIQSFLGELINSLKADEEQFKNYCVRKETWDIEQAKTFLDLIVSNASVGKKQAIKKGDLMVYVSNG